MSLAPRNVGSQNSVWQQKFGKCDTFVKVVFLINVKQHDSHTQKKRICI